MVYFAYGFPKALNTGCEAGSTANVVYTSFGGSDYLVVVSTATVQIWSGGQHRLKLGEITRDGASLASEGANVAACWCPSRRAVAVATDLGCLHFYGLHLSKEVLWHCPGGYEAHRVSVYLQNSLRLDQEPGAADATEAVAALCGDPRSLLAVLSSGRLLSLSWQGKLRGAAHPLVGSTDATRAHGRYSRLRRASSTLNTQPTPASSIGSPSRTASTSDGAELAMSPALLGHAFAAALSPGEPLPPPPAAEQRDVAVRAAHYAPALLLLVLVLRDGRAALLQLPPQGGLAGVEHARLLRWIYKPSTPSVGAVAAAIQPGGQLLALGLAHGRVALYSMPALLRTQRDSRQSLDANALDLATLVPSGPGSAEIAAVPPLRAFQAAGAGTGTAVNGSGPGQPDPLRVLSLTEWGYSSTLVGAARELQWSPDGRVFAVGYSRRGLAVWTPSGCRIMCSLRQAAQAMMTHPGAEATPSPSAPPSRDASADAEGPVRRQPSDAAARADSPSLLNPQHQGPSIDAGILEGGVAALAWSPNGYSLLVAELTGAALLLELPFAKALQGQHRVADVPLAPPTEAEAGAEEAAPGTASTGCFVLQAADRLLLVTESRSAGAVSAGLVSAAEGEASGALRPELQLRHARLPQQYIDAAWPLRTAAVSADGRDIAVAGSRGVALYSCRAQRWRLFGDAMQERRIKTHALAWLDHGVVAVCATVDDSPISGGGGAALEPCAALLLYPRHHLDAASLLARHALPQQPLAMDAAGVYIVLAFSPLEIKVLRAELGGGGKAALRPGSVGLTTVRELSILSMGGTLQQLALLPDPPGLSGALGEPHAAATPSAGNGRSPVQQGAADGEEEGQQLLEAGRPAGGLAPISIHPAQRTSKGPGRCMLLRTGGVLSVLDLEQGCETALSDEIETFWLPVASAAGPAVLKGFRSAAEFSASSVSNGASHLSREASDAAVSASGRSGSSSGASLPALNGGGGGGGSIEMPWWTYGARGMQLWFPSSLADPLSPGSVPGSPAPGAGARGCANMTDPELEFDKEVYPLGVSLAEVSIVGVMQRTVRSAAFPPSAPPSLSFHPHPESQPVLPCLLRRLLQRGRGGDAVQLATRHSRGPHFARSLEWLLFTTLEADADAPRDPASARAAAAGFRVRFSSAAASPGGGIGAAAAAGLAAGLRAEADPFSPKSAGPAARRLARAGPLLVAAARLVQQFPQFAEIVVSVARKTDAQLWPALFAAAGSPADLCEGLLQCGALQSAACCLLIVDHVEGVAEAHALALRLIGAALAAKEFELAADLMRFLMPPGDADLLGMLGMAGGVESAGNGGGAGDGAEIESEAEQQQGGGASSWFWSVFGGSGEGPRAPPPPALPLAAATGSATAALHYAVSSASPADLDLDHEHMELTPVTHAWRVMGRHAWQLLDAGALCDLAALAAAMEPLRGGLAALLSTTAGEAPPAVGHTRPSAAAIASALFVASNEFAVADVDVEAAAAAARLQAVCAAAGCVNHEAALALLLGDLEAVELLSGRHHREWKELTELIANDVHLCRFTSALSRPGTPLMK